MLHIRRNRDAFEAAQRLSTALGLNCLFDQIERRALCASALRQRNANDNNRCKSPIALHDFSSSARRLIRKFGKSRSNVTQEPAVNAENQWVSPHCDANSRTMRLA